jgi:chorismate binding enzyme
MYSCRYIAWPAAYGTALPDPRAERASDVGICTGAGNLSRRGVYSSALGYISLTQAADLSIVIQTAAVEPDAVSYGSAVIALSEPDTEVDPLLCLPDQEFPE